jgi:hypothetical protein
MMLVAWSVAILFIANILAVAILWFVRDGGRLE